MEYRSYSFSSTYAAEVLSAIANNKPIWPIRLYDQTTLLQIAAACISSARAIDPWRDREQAETNKGDIKLIVDCFADLSELVADGIYRFEPNQSCTICDFENEGKTVRIDGLVETN